MQVNTVIVKDKSCYWKIYCTILVTYAESFRSEDRLYQRCSCKCGFGYTEVYPDFVAVLVFLPSFLVSERHFQVQFLNDKHHINKVLKHNNNVYNKVFIIYKVYVCVV